MVDLGVVAVGQHILPRQQEQERLIKDTKVGHRTPPLPVMEMGEEVALAVLVLRVVQTKRSVAPTTTAALASKPT